MEKLANGMKKVARLIVVICLFILAAFEIVDLINSLGGPFTTSIYWLLRAILLVLLYLVPAILLTVKKDKEGFVTFSFLLGYLVLGGAINFLGNVALINTDNPALVVIKAILMFIIGILFAIAIICLLLTKGFGLKTMKFGTLLLALSLILVFALVIVELISTIKYDSGFGGFVRSLLIDLIVPLVTVFGLVLIGNEN